jgi:hypothetical protein
MGRNYQFSVSDINALTAKLGRPIKDAEAYFIALAIMMDQDTQAQFRNEGAAGGYRKIPNNLMWPAFKLSTLRMPSGTFRIRYGTNIKPRGPSFRGKFWKGVRRYSMESKLLQASGGFRKSFGILEVGPQGLKFGTEHELAGKIGSKPRREVLFVTDEDKKRYARKFAKFIRQGLIK